MRKTETNDNRKTNEYADGQTDIWTERPTDRQTNRYTDGRTNIQTDEQTDLTFLNLKYKTAPIPLP